MNEIEKRENIPSTSSLSKTGVRAVGYTAAGIFLIILNIVTRAFWPGLIIGAIIAFFGIGSLRSKDPADKRAGIIITAAGLLTVLSKIPIPFIQGLSGVLLGIGAVGLIIVGIWNGIKFIIGLGKRS